MNNYVDAKLEGERTTAAAGRIEENQNIKPFTDEGVMF